MQAKLAFYNELVSVIMYFIAAITFFFVVQIMIAGELSPFYVHVLFVVCFASVIGIRHFINGNFLIYMAAHFTLFATLIAIPVQSVMFIVFAVYLISMTFWSVSYWKKPQAEADGNIPWVSVTLFIISYIYAFVSHHDVLKNYLLVTGSLYLLLFLVRYYLKGIYDLSNNRLISKRLPMMQIIRSDTYLFGILLAITAITMVMANLIDLDNLLYVIGDGLISILRVLIKSFFIILTWIADLISNVNADGLESLWDELSKAFMEEETGSKLLNMILSMVKIAVTVLFLLWILRGMNIKIRQFLKDNTLPMDRVERIRKKEKGLNGFSENIF